MNITSVVKAKMRKVRAQSEWGWESHRAVRFNPLVTLLEQEAGCFDQVLGTLTRDPFQTCTCTAMESPWKQHAHSLAIPMVRQGAGQLALLQGLCGFSSETSAGRVPLFVPTAIVGLDTVFRWEVQCSAKCPTVAQ